jgi:hypothetical protein
MGRRVYLAGVRPDLVKIIERARMQNVLPASQLVFHTGIPWKPHQTASRVRDVLPRDAALPDEWLRYFHPTHSRFEAI